MKFMIPEEEEDLKVEKLLGLRFRERERERDEFRKVRRQVLSREIGEK